ncbi:hypothetical protein [Lampropedia aestuarii]|uniref:hypothetical protein n=1 Tax=Lampropedia aestuarii TaxID=2562762 RepID=UPI001455E0BF|nr:hypothetical protein [Lampropedia aestuarii]
MLDAFEIFQDANEGGDVTLKKAEVKLAGQFNNTFDKVFQAGFLHLGTVEEAHFDVRVE